jgi:hypothetical protein
VGLDKEVGWRDNWTEYNISYTQLHTLRGWT